ncbi:MAG: hypothetical protein ABIY35_04640 [Chitinophagaceae bacterium]
MLNKFSLLIFSLFLFGQNSKAQSYLPDFSVTDLGNNNIRISWQNPYANGCIQLSVQRSYDNKFFTTVFSTPSPELPENGFIDKRESNSTLYYRIFYVLGNSTYFFTPVKIAGAGYATDPVTDMQDEKQIITVLFEDTTLATYNYSDYKHFRDSIITQTRDSLFTINQDEVLLKLFDPGSTWVPSRYVFTNANGYVQVNLPEAEVKNFKIIFFDSDGKKLFTINHVKETQLLIDKTNFIHAGWFNFQLYENDALKERNKVLLQKDF